MVAVEVVRSDGECEYILKETAEFAERSYVWCEEEKEAKESTGILA